MFIKKRKTSKGYSCQLVKSYRMCGKVKQAIVVNLGPFSTINEAIAYTNKRMQWFEEKPGRIEKMLRLASSRLCYQYAYWNEWNQKLKDVVSQMYPRGDNPDTTKEVSTV